jgi:hypothetical protein
VVQTGEAKMKFFLGYIVIAILLFAGCENLTESQRGGSISSSYYPLEIGNKWYYKYWDRFDSTFVYPESIAMTEEVVASRYLNNKLFYLVETCYLNLDGSVRAKDSVYYNFSGDTLYQILNNWDFSEESLSIRAIFADTGHVSFRMKWSDDYYEVYSRFETDTTINFVYYQPNWTDSGSEWKFMKGVGVCDYISYQTVGKRLVNYEF